MATRWTIDDVLKTPAGRASLALIRAHASACIAPAPNASQANPPKRPKYGNRKVLDAAGNVHDSGKEYRNWCALQLRERAGEISDLRRHVRFDFCFNGVFIGHYTADATYQENGRLVVEDTKSDATRKIRDYPLRRNLMRACHSITIREV